MYPKEEPWGAGSRYLPCPVAVPLGYSCVPGIEMGSTCSGGRLNLPFHQAPTKVGSREAHPHAGFREPKCGAVEQEQSGLSFPSEETAAQTAPSSCLWSACSTNLPYPPRAKRGSTALWEFVPCAVIQAGATRSLISFTQLSRLAIRIAKTFLARLCSCGRGGGTFLLRNNTKRSFVALIIVGW